MNKCKASLLAVFWIASALPLMSHAQSQLPANFLGLTMLELGPEGSGGAQDDLLTARTHAGHSAASIKPALNSSIVPATPAAASIPLVAGLPVRHGSANSGFAGLSHFDQRFAGTGPYANTQFSLEPPDQGLCAGNGYVMEAVNNAIAVYNQQGVRVGGPKPLSQFFNLAPEVVRVAPVTYGQFISDPRCHYDADSKRWFVTELEIDTNPATGAFANTHSSVIVAVSQSADPTGAYYVYSFDTTSGDGSDPLHPLCPCFGDQPLTGLDANGLYISTNEFPIIGAGFNGAQIYALSKASLINGIAPPVLHFSVGTTVPVPPADQAAGGIWYSIQPAKAPPGGAGNQDNGAEFFLSALQFASAYDNRVAVWALTNTRSLNSHSPNLHLVNTLVSAESYGFEGNFAATQKAGPTPLRDALGDVDPIEQITANDDRMNQVVYAAGHLWSGVNTTVSVGGQVQQGIAWFAVTPTLDDGNLSASIYRQGYIAVDGESVVFPSIGVNAQGNAVIAFSLIGPDYWPSLAYAPIGASGQVASVRVAALGLGPDDGFTAYAAYGGSGFARWGDYSAATADEHGNIWFAAESINQTCTFAQFALDTTCGGTRSLLANWGTYISHVGSGD